MYCLFLITDEAGNFVESLFGPNVIPDKSYDFFFYVSEEVAIHAFNYKVVLDGIKPQLVRK